MNKIVYNSQDDILLIDDVPYVGGFFKPDNVWGIVWTAPNKLWIESMDGQNETREGPYPHQAHIDRWDALNVEAMEALRIEEEEQKKAEEEYQERLDKISELKSKISLVFQEAGYCLDSNELHLMFGEELEDCK